MINDFDSLLAQCKARALKKTLRITLRILLSIVLIILGILGFHEWQIFTQKSTVIKPSYQIITPPSHEQNNTTITAVIAPAVVKSTTIPTPATSNIAPAPISDVTPIAIKPTIVPNNRLLEVSNASSNPLTPEQTYQHSPKFETALGIAHDFYLKEEYAQAAIWAKKANQMNREAEEAWLLYAKSYYAQGKKNEAISVLELYLNYKDSKVASDLIKTWR